MREKGGIVAKLNFFLSALLIVAGLGWWFVQKGVHQFVYQPEAKETIEMIKKGEEQYRLHNNAYLPFRKNAAQALKALEIDLSKTRYYDYSVIRKDRETIHIIAELKPEMLKRWYFIGPKTPFKLVFVQQYGTAGQYLTLPPS